MQNKMLSDQRERPRSLVISLTNLCTTRCEFCYRRDLHLKPRFFPFERFKSLLDELGPTLEILEFSGIGEPLMHSQFKEFALYARQRYSPQKLKLQLVTNGSLLSADLCNFLIEQEFEQVWVSLNAATPETYSIMMPGLDFNKVKQSIVSLNAEMEKDYLQKPSIVLTFVVTKLNYQEVEDFLDLGVMLGADRIEARSLDRLLNKNIYDSQHVSKEEFEPILERIEARAKSDNRIGCAPRWAFWPDDFPQPNHRDGKSIYCPNAQSVFGIYFTSGEVTPCCYTAAYIENPENCIGNIYEKSALEIWNGQRAISLIDSLEDVETAPNICKLCLNYWGKQWESEKHRSRFLEVVTTAIKRNRVVQILANQLKQAEDEHTHKDG